MKDPTYSTFADRAHAGRALAAAVAQRRPEPSLLVLALPRGGVPVAAEVARRLAAPLDVLVVRKIGLPEHPELAAGAIATGGVLVRNPMLAQQQISEAAFARVVERETAEMLRREHVYRAGRPPLRLREAHVLLVDDGLATGTTMLAAIQAARGAGASRVMVAVPVASEEAAALIGAAADEMVVLLTPPWLGSIGEFYDSFEQLTDAEVTRILGTGQ